MTRVLVLGCGGVGCELIKNLILSGDMISFMTIVDMDTIELSNLNRQFMYRQKDIGQPKALVTKEFVLNRWPWMKDRIECHYCDMKDLNVKFYAVFDMIFSGLDSLEARRWINGLVVELALAGRLIPIIDVGSEGYAGHVAVILPGITACVECLLPLFAIENKPLCTFTDTPKSIENCIEWAAYVHWGKYFDRQFELENSTDTAWILVHCLVRAKDYNLPTLDLTMMAVQNHLKRVIPSISTTNSAIAGLCVTKARQILSGVPISKTFKNFIIFNSETEIYINQLIVERVEGCSCCGRIRRL